MKDKKDIRFEDLKLGDLSSIKFRYAYIWKEQTGWRKFINKITFGLFCKPLGEFMDFDEDGNPFEFKDDNTLAIKLTKNQD